MTNKNQGRERLMGLIALLALTLVGVAYVEKDRVLMLFLDAHREPEIPFQAAPPEIRAFLTQARAADAIADPLERCLAFPDIPGNQWPSGLARTHCLAQYGPRISHAQIDEYVRLGKVVQLDQLFAKDLDRHFAKSDFSEIIHTDFNSIWSDASSEAMTRRWLELDPDSAFALTARARYFRNLAEMSRGGEYAKNVPAEDLRLMSGYATQAIDLYMKAVQIEPRMMPAYGGLITMGMMDSRPEVVSFASDHAMAQDPGCEQVSSALMTALQPRWGGSIQAMTALANKLSPEIERRPFLALVVVEPYLAQADEFYNDKHVDGSLKILTPVAQSSTSTELLEDYARSLIDTDHFKYRWEIIMYLLEATRFHSAHDWSISVLGGDLAMNASDIEWSIAVLERGVMSEPENAYAHFALGQSYEFANQPIYAEREYRLAMRDSRVQPEALAALDKLMKAK